jgi:repressor of nif and glnA expression
MGTLFVNQEDVERKVLLILRVLHEAQSPVGSRVISRRMQDMGIGLSERTVRYHLKLMDQGGLTQLVGRRDGRVITQKGIDELGNARVRDKVGMAISRIEILSFSTMFNPERGKGQVPVNISLFSKEEFPYAIRHMAPVFEAGFAVSDRVAVAGAGDVLANVVVPPGKVGLATVCSIVINGVLLKHGIPMDSKFGGILQVKNRKPLRFVELISYADRPSTLGGFYPGTDDLRQERSADGRRDDPREFPRNTRHLLFPHGRAPQEDESRRHQRGFGYG